MIKKLKSSNNGITLIELVVTVAVMLILIGIIVNVATGDNGLLQKARQMKKDEIAAEQNAQIKINEIKEDKATTNDGVVQKTDTQPPVINKIIIYNITARSFKVEVDVTELESGLKKIEYSIDNGKTWYPTTADTDQAVTYKYTFYGLKSATGYTVLVKATDKAGNVSTGTQTGTTK